MLYEIINDVLYLLVQKEGIIRTKTINDNGYGSNNIRTRTRYSKRV